MSVKRLLALSAFVFAAITPAALASVQYKIESDRFAPLESPSSPKKTVKLTGIPVDGRMQSLTLERFDVFAPNAEIKVLGDHDEVLEKLPLPSIRTYRGSIDGAPDSSVFLSIAEGRIDGIVFMDDRRFGIGSRPRTHKQRTTEGDGIDVFIQESEVVDEIPSDGVGFFCDADRTALARIPTPRIVPHSLIPRSQGALSSASARWVVNLAVETDYELYLNSGSSSGNVTTFITNLVGAMSTIYVRELTAEVVVTSLTINSVVGDPFNIVPGTAGSWNGIAYNCTSSTAVSPPDACLGSLHALLEFGDRWHNSPPSAVARSSAALISGKPQLAGVAWVNWLGRADFFNDTTDPEPYRLHYGGAYSFNGGIDPPGDLSVPNPDTNAPIYTLPSSNYWPLFQVSHETGHNVFSGHTHCRVLSAPDQVTYGRTYVDNCYKFEGGCFSGTQTVPTEKGTIMSYCHLIAPNFATNSRFIFGKVGEASHVVPEDMKTALQNATPSLSVITAPATLAAGASGTASVTNVAGMTYLWTITNGVINSGQGTNSINFTANTNPTNVKVKATNTASNPGPQGQTGCSITDNKDVVVTSVAYNPPTNVAATATSATSVSITWSTPSGTAPVQYDIYRSSNGTTYSQINFVAHPTTNYTDNTASANTAYLYKVRSAAAAGANESADSNRDLATTVIFSDDPLVVGTTTVQAVHLTQLRTAVNAVRALASLGAGSYTDPTITATTTPIKAVHITDLRTALDAARSNLALTAITYGESIAGGSTTVKASHFTELRNGVK